MPNYYLGHRDLAYSNLRVSANQLDTHGVPIAVNVQLNGG